MRDIIDQLIEERAGWLSRSGTGVAVARNVLRQMLGYERTVRIGERLADMPGTEVMDTATRMFTRNVEATGLENLPKSGAFIITANHPTGIADGLALYNAIAPQRPDLFFFANSDALRVFPQLDRYLAPVEWRKDKRGHRQNRETMIYAHRAFKEGRPCILFPSGRLAKRRGLRLHERPWMPSCAMLARKFELPIVPLHITARNSLQFYLFDMIHPTLRDITLFHEVLNKTHQPYRIKIGEPIDPATLPSGSVEATEVLRDATLSLGGEVSGTQKLLRPSSGKRRSRLRPGRVGV